MVDVKISDLTDGAPIATGDLIEIERPGSPSVSRKATLGDAAGKNIGATAGTVAAGDDARFHAALLCQIQDVDGIATGTFSAAAYYHGAASFGHLYAEILAGTGDAVLYIHQNGVEVYGPVTVDSDSDPVDASDLGVTLAIGDTIDVVVTSADATITSLMIQMDGSA